MSRSKKPRVVSFRVSEEEWLAIEKAASKIGDTPHEWGRMASLEKLRMQDGLNSNERILFAQVARTQYLVGIGFQMLADDKLTTEEWKKLRTFAKEEIDVITNRALADYQSRTKSEARKVA
jgi:hypothetical protein